MEMYCSPEKYALLQSILQIHMFVIGIMQYSRKNLDKEILILFLMMNSIWHLLAQWIPKGENNWDLSTRLQAMNVCMMQKWQRLCWHENESRSERCFGSRSKMWLGLWFELCAFTCIANAFPITIRICALRGNILRLLRSLRWLTHAWLQHGFSVHFLNAHAQITFRKSFTFTCPRIRLSTRITIQNALFFSFQNAFQNCWFETALHSHGLKSGFQIRKGPNHIPKCLLERDSFSCKQAQCYNKASYATLYLWNVKKKGYCVLEERVRGRRGKTLHKFKEKDKQNGNIKYVKGHIQTPSIASQTNSKHFKNKIEPFEGQQLKYCLFCRRGRGHILQFLRHSVCSINSRRVEREV